MTNKSHRLQKQAAAMFVAGRHDYDIITECGIRESTLKRWKNAPVFKNETFRLQAEWQIHRPVRTQKLMEDFLDAITRALAAEELHPKNLAIAFAFAQQLDFNGHFMSRGASTLYKELQKRSETVPNSAETVPESFQTVP